MKPAAILPSLVPGLIAGLATISVVPAMAQDRDVDWLRDRLSDCSGPPCVPLRDRMLDRLRDSARTCVPDGCRPLRVEIRDQERLRSCDASGDACTALRRQVRQREQRGYAGPLPFDRGGEGGMDSGMGGGM